MNLRYFYVFRDVRESLCALYFGGIKVVTTPVNGVVVVVIISGKYYISEKRFVKFDVKATS